LEDTIKEKICEPDMSLSVEINALSSGDVIVR